MNYAELDMNLNGRNASMVSVELASNGSFLNKTKNLLSEMWESYSNSFEGCEPGGWGLLQ